MEITMLPIGKLEPSKYNPRKISREMLGALKRNIREFGLVDVLPDSLEHDIAPRLNEEYYQARSASGRGRRLRRVWCR